MQLTFNTSVSVKPLDYNLIYCSVDNISEVSAWIEKVIGAKVLSPSKAWAEVGNRVYYHNGTQQFCFAGIGSWEDISLERIRKKTMRALNSGNEHKHKTMLVHCPGIEDSARGSELIGAITETLILGNYQYLSLKTHSSKPNSLQAATVVVRKASLKQAAVEAQKIAEATCIARDLVNEPVITLSAEELGNRAKQLGKQYKFSVEVWNKAKIEKNKFGGLLAVNYGSILPPTFSILEWKPAGAKNQKPIVLVGKGVVYDTGGLSLKPTPNSMDSMKSDMAGAAAVIGAFCAIAELQLPIHVIGLIPATDNRPGEQAYTPGDVIHMHDGSTVEVLNTDAEGRMILADALAYAKKLKPELVIDLATLTGAAVVAVGNIGIAMMSTADAKVNQQLQSAGHVVHERMVEFPLWEEYDDLLKSDIADQKNIGGPGAGSITAAKFLQKFTDYPWIHLDIAGPAFLPQQDSYRSKNGTGVGVRLLVAFLKGYGKG
jgi:leucyl aminopeptidase